MRLDYQGALLVASHINERNDIMCMNQVSYFIARGYSHKEIFVRCGNTDPYGGRAQCEKCENSRSARAEHERIMQNSDDDNAWLASAGWGEM